MYPVELNNQVLQLHAIKEGTMEIPGWRRGGFADRPPHSGRQRHGLGSEARGGAAIRHRRKQQATSTTDTTRSRIQLSTASQVFLWYHCRRDTPRILVRLYIVYIVRWWEQRHLWRETSEYCLALRGDTRPHTRSPDKASQPCRHTQ